MHVVPRTILSAIVVIAVIYCYRDKTNAPIFCVILVAASLLAQVLVARKGNLLPLLRAWLMGGALAAFVYPLDLLKTDAYDIPTGYSYAAAFIGCLFAGVWSWGERRSFWTSQCELATSDNEEDRG